MNSFSPNVISPDLETRFSAIDALGNFFKSISVNVIEASIVNSDETNSFKQNAKMDESSCNIQREVNLITSFLKKSLTIFVSNLRYCELCFLRSSNSFEGYNY